MELRQIKNVKNWIMIVILIISTSIQAWGCDKNVFFKIDIPEGWEESCIHSSENLCYYKYEDFHGMPALSYTFGGTTHGVIMQERYIL